MKKFISIFIIALSISFISCNRDRDNFDSSAQPAQEVANDAKTDDNAEQDTTKKDTTNLSKVQMINESANYKTYIDSLYKKQQTEIDSLHNQMKDMIPADSVYFCLGIACVVLLLIIIFVYNKLSNRCHYLRRKINEIPLPKPGTSHTHRYNLDASLENIVKRLDSLEREVKYGPLRYDLGGITQGCQEGNSGESPKEDPNGGKKEEPKVEHVSREFYMPRTLEERQFTDSKKKSSRDESTFFKFTLDSNNPKKAKFVFDPYDARSITASFDDRDNSLATACDIEVESNSPSGFKCDGSGEAELKNGIWEVTTKLKLKYV